jgi:hypothetical protein
VTLDANETNGAAPVHLDLSIRKGGNSHRHHAWSNETTHAVKLNLCEIGTHHSTRARFSASIACSAAFRDIHQIIRPRFEYSAFEIHLLNIQPSCIASPRANKQAQAAPVSQPKTSSKRHRTSPSQGGARFQGNRIVFASDCIDLPRAIIRA